MSWQDENQKREQESEKKVLAKMFSSLDYINWLQGILDEYRVISDEDLLYNDKIDAIDKKNIKYLELFYEGIKKYADDNYIYPELFPGGQVYKIRLSDFGIEVGFTCGQGICMFCRKSIIDNQDDYIDFMDIINRKKKDNVEKINEMLNYLKDVIYLAYEEGAPIEAIDDTCKTVIGEVKNEQKGMSFTWRKW